MSFTNLQWKQAIGMPALGDYIEGLKLKALPKAVRGQAVYRDSPIYGASLDRLSASSLKVSDPEAFYAAAKVYARDPPARPVLL